MQPSTWLLRAGAALVVLPAILRTLVTTEPLPGWDADPAIYPYTQAGIGPGETAMLSAVMMLGSGLLIAGAGLAGSLRRWLAGLALLAACAPLLHAVVLHADHAEQVRIALDWSAALLAGGALAATVRRGTALHTLLVTCVLGTALAMACKGAVQMLIEHPAVLADYRVNGERFLGSQGWAPGSPQALQFERRLRDPVATGWFGLSNVYATFAAGSFVAFAVWAVSAWRARAAVWLPPVLGSIAAVLGWSAWVSGSKGAWAAAVFGLAGVGVLGLLRGGRWRGWVARGLGLGAVVLPIGAIVLRGAIGERIGELSLLFRWFYMRGTVAVFGETLPIGPGPDGFKDWYARLKPAIAPEDVASPHSVLFDYAGTMGLLSIPAIGLVLALACRLPPHTPPTSPPTSPHAHQHTDSADETWLAGALKPWVLSGLLGIALVSVWGASIESAMATPESAVARLLGIGLITGGVAAVFIASVRGGLSAVGFARGLGGAALTVMAHAQIEMTPTQPASAGLCFVLLGLAAAESIAADRGREPAGGTGVEQNPRARARGSLFVARAGIAQTGIVLGLLACVAAGIVAFGPGQKLRAWQGALRDAAALFMPMHAAEEIGASERAGIDAGARVRLGAALALFPGDDRVHRAMVENARNAALSLGSTSDTDRARVVAREVLELADGMIEACPGVASVWALRASARLQLSDAGLIEPDADAAITDALRSAELDPFNPQARARLALLADRFGRRGLASEQAGEAIRMSEQRRLDPLTQLPDREIRRLRTLVD